MANAVGANAVGTNANAVGTNANAVGTNANAVGTSAVGTSAVGMEIEETDYNDLFESICILTEAYIHLNLKQFIQPSFHSGAVKDIVSILNHTLAQTAFDTTSLEKEVERGLSLFYKHIAPPRSNGPTFIRIKPNVNKLRQKINYLQSVPQPEQRTK